MVFVDGGPRGVFGGLCRANVVELTRGGAGGVPLDTTRSTLVSYLFVGEVPGDGPAGWFVPGGHGPGIRGPFLGVTIGVINWNAKNERRAPERNKKVVTEDLNGISLLTDVLFKFIAVNQRCTQ